MAEEQLAPVEGGEGEVVHDAPAIENEHQDDPIEIARREAKEELARDLGWTTKDEWRGDPDKWKPAEQFIRDGRDIQQSTSRELKAVREELSRIGGATSQIMADKIAERDAYWQQQMRAAVDEGDTEAVLELTKQRPQPGVSQQQQGPDPEVAAWVAKNPWYNTDPLAQARAQELSDRLKHLSVPDQLAQVDRAIRKEFPEHFPAPTKPPPATQTAQSRNPNPSNRVKGFADMPAASQAVALDYEKRLGVPKETTAKSYWADQEGVKR